MTMGPEPMTRTLWMSSRLGIVLLGRAGDGGEHEVSEAVEEVVGIVRAGGGLGVVLHREGGDVEGPQPLHHLVVEAHVAHLDAAVAVGAVERPLQRGLDGEPVVVRRDLDAAGLLVEHGLVDAAVAEGQLVRVEPERAAEQLVAEADAEERQAVIEHAAQQLDVVARGRGVAGAVGVEDGDGVDRPDASIVTSCGSTCTSNPRAARLSIVACLTPRSRTARFPMRSPWAGVTSAAETETDAERFCPAISGASRTRRSCSSSSIPAASPEKMPPRMLPAERMWRVTARVSMPLMPTTPSSTRASSSDWSARQFDTTREGSRTM